MNDSHKTEFWAMLNVLMELMNKPPISKEAVIVWWHKLKEYDIQTVRNAFDRWADTQDKPPTPSQIKELCKPKDDFLKLPKKPDKEAQQAGRKKLQDFIEQHYTPRIME